MSVLYEDSFVVVVAFYSFLMTVFSFDIKINIVYTKYQNMWEVDVDLAFNSIYTSIYYIPPAFS